MQVPCIPGISQAVQPDTAQAGGEGGRADHADGGARQPEHRQRERLLPVHSAMTRHSRFAGTLVLVPKSGFVHM